MPTHKASEDYTLRGSKTRSFNAQNRAQQVLAQFDDIPIRRTKLRLIEATKIVYNHNTYAYDAYVLDCARQYRSPLLSLDNQLKVIGEKLELNVLEISQ